MRNLNRKTILFSLFTVQLTACNSFVPTPVASPTHSVETATPTTIAVAETNTAIATQTPIAISISTPTATPSTGPSLPTEISITIPGGIVYYHFVNLADYAPPPGSVVIMPDNLILAPTQLDIAYGSEVSTDLRSALEAVLKDERNYWLSNKLQIKQLSYTSGHADVILEGEYSAVAPVVLTAARAQILLTLFANTGVQSTTVTINGDNIANISISHSMDAKPNNYAYRRAEVETFMTENAYVQP